MAYKYPLTEDVFDSHMGTLNSQIKTLNGLVATIARENAPETVDWNYLEELASDDVFGTMYDIGTTFSEEWEDKSDNKKYTFPWMLNHIGDVELSDGEILTSRPFLQMKYAHPFGVQFSHNRAFLRCPSGLSAGTYNIHFAQVWSKLTVLDWNFTLTQDVPAGGRLCGFLAMADSTASTSSVSSYSSDGKTVIETFTAYQGEISGATDLGTLNYNTRNGDLNSMQEVFFGWNRWSKSAIRQYLNSAAGIGQWWLPQDEWDIAPNQLTTKAGFLSGCSEAFVEKIKTVKIVTYPNTVYDDTSGNTPDITYDKVFLPSLEEMYISPQKKGEGVYHERWKRQSGLSDPMKKLYSTYPQIITYAVENHSSAQSVRLRSAYRTNAISTWHVYSSGYVTSNDSCNAYRFSPLVVL